MAKLLTGDGRTHVSSDLMRESLVSKKLLAQTDNRRIRRMVPDVHLVAIGGQSIMDRGREAILPLVDEIAELKDHYKLVIGVGGGARARHTFAIGLDLGLPVGGAGTNRRGRGRKQSRHSSVFAGSTWRHHLCQGSLSGSAVVLE